MAIDIAALRRQARQIWLTNKLLAEAEKQAAALSDSDLARKLLAKAEKQAAALGDFYLAHQLSLVQIIALLQLEIDEPKDFTANLVTYLWQKHQAVLIRANQNPDYTSVIKKSLDKVQIINNPLAASLAEELNFITTNKEKLNQAAAKPVEQQTLRPLNNFKKTPIYSLFVDNIVLPAVSELPLSRRDDIPGGIKSIKPVVIQQNNPIIKSAAPTSSGIYPTSITPSVSNNSIFDKFHALKLTIYNLFKNIGTAVATIITPVSERVLIEEKPVTTPLRMQQLKEDNMDVGSAEEKIDTPPREQTLADNKAAIEKSRTATTPKRTRSESSDELLALTPLRKQHHAEVDPAEEKIDTPPRELASATNAAAITSSYHQTTTAITRRSSAAKNLLGLFNTADEHTTSTQESTASIFSQKLLVAYSSKDENGNIIEVLKDATDTVNRIIPGLKNELDKASATKATTPLQHQHNANPYSSIILKTPPRQPTAANHEQPISTPSRLGCGN